MEVFTKDIESIILENFDKAQKSIVIVVAWFTNPKIIYKLIQLKRLRELEIQILVDDNEVNRKYFFDLHFTNLEANGIIVKRQYISKFNHNKYAIIDNETLITGSYNYTIKANRNFENVVIEKDARIANFYFRIFNFFTDRNYRDSNIKLLYDNPDFANKLISSYYPFSSKLFSKLKDKINLGYCFTHENGLYDEISYEPGLIFNPKFTLHKELISANKKTKLDRGIPDFDSNLYQEFDLPISKNLIANFEISEINNFNYQTSLEYANFNQTKIDYDELTDSFNEVEIALTKFYTRKFKAFYTVEELQTITAKNFNIIIEDYIWINNFSPFLNDDIVESIYAKL
jgi:hypothetical protein